MAGSIEAAAYHEAGHVVALRRCGIRVHGASASNDGSGVTNFESLPARDEDVILVVLAGMHAGPTTAAADIQTHIRQFFETVSGARSDMKLLFDRFQELWLANTPLWHNAQHNRAEKFAQANRSQIEVIARAILAKSSDPKVIDESEINSILSI